MRRRITFREVFITIAVLLMANLAVNLFTASTTPNPAAPVSVRDYQLDMMPNGDAILFDGNRPVGTIRYHGHEACQFNKLITEDNR